MLTTRNRLFIAFGLLAGLSACGDGSDPIGTSPLTPGQTDFTSETPGSAGASPSPTGPTAGGARGSAAGEGGSDSANKTAAPPAAPPMGRTGEVEEGDIYRISDNRLFYLNTYRGFVVYDVNDPKNPVQLSRLPVFGYPIEMFVDGTTVYALLRDALYLTQSSGKMQFERHNVSQLVAIDVSDIRNPRVLKTVDIIGELREGVSRKIENTIYVVSYIPQSYYWGWRYGGQAPPQKEQAWVYSFDVSDRKDPKLVKELKVFEGGSVQFNDPKGGFSFNRNFNGVAISATSNTLMVVENWQVSGYSSGPSTGSGGSSGSSTPSSGPRGCGSYESDQQAVVSIIDISDPRGTIRVHARFETAGQLTDQFKQTYVYDPQNKTATYYGIFARQGWSSADCSGAQIIQNTIQSWDVTDGAQPAKLHSLDFGKTDETVRASSFDVDRKVAYAITARQVDPLYAISFADRKNLKILSAIDGLSGDMNVFRLIAGKQYLMGIGRDTSATCTGFQDGDGWRAANVAVSIIDVRDLTKIRLVQRACVAVKNANWIGSEINWNLDQAHKMIGMYSDEQVNVITVPVYYHRESAEGDWWWYRFETAVGMMTWDLSRYDQTKSEREQTVLRNFGTFVHPEGQVRRSIVFKHGGSAQRMMINLSDTHVSIANIEDLANPRLESMIELAPYYGEIYQFGDYVVEHIQASRDYGSWASQSRSEFRIKQAGGDLDKRAAVATFSVGQVQRVLQHKSSLVLFRTAYPRKTSRGEYLPPKHEAIVYDLSDPTKPTLAGRTDLPETLVPYYRYACGVGPYWGGFWFDAGGNNWTVTDAGIVFLEQGYYSNDPRLEPSVSTSLRLLDLRTPGAPRLRQQTLSVSRDWGFNGLIGDPADPKGFYLSYVTRVGEVKSGDTTFTRFRYLADRWDVDGDRMVVRHSINLPGRLARTWADAKGTRLFVAQDHTYKQVVEQNNTYWRPEMRVSLLRQIALAGRPVAELLATHRFADTYLNALVIDGDKLFATGRKQNSYYYGGDVAVAGGAPTRGVAAESAPVIPWEESSDRLMIFDLSKLSLNLVYDAPMKTFGVDLMGTHQGKLFVNLPGDGILVVDVHQPASPQGTRFLRTLGYASHITFAGNDAYVAAGHFGIYHLDLSAPADIPLH